MRKSIHLKNFIYIISVIALFSCESKEKKAIALYNSYCASCHVLPAIENLPKHIWEEGVLPDMGARMGIYDSTYDPYEKVSRMEEFAI